MTVNVLLLVWFLQRSLCIAARCSTYELDITPDTCEERDGGTSQRQNSGECIFSCNFDKSVCAYASWYATWVTLSSGTQYVIGFASYTSTSASGATFTGLWTNVSDTRPRLVTDKLRIDNKTGNVHVSSCSSSGFSVECHMTVCHSSSTPSPTTVRRLPTDHVSNTFSRLGSSATTITSLFIMTFINVFYAILLS
ncbi:m16 protein [Murid betaherpesvirus 1]|nr:m16 protein [Murid betaherpesvirus 1]